ncbi:MAG: preprotein translocase subunit YajC [Bacteroidales bacterium]|nr:preprotein translocase subunit YajC [Bacteroidales bacterium]
MMLNYILLEAAPAQGGGMGSIIMIVALIAIFYFFMIRPQSKKQKEMKKFREGLKAGDKVITAGGIHGRIRKIESNGTVMLEIADGVKIVIDATMIYPTMQDAVQTGSDVKKED